MPSEQLVQDAAGSSLSPIVFGVDASLNPVDDATNFTDDIGTDTADVVLTLAGVAAAAARQSNKVDLGALRAAEYLLIGVVDFSGETITTPGTVEYYWAPSTDEADANSNVAGNSGVDADAPGGAVGGITQAEFLAQCVLLGSLTLHDGASVQCGPVGILRSTTRHGQLIVVNKCSEPFEDDDVEMHQVLQPIVPESQ
jgi:hypothetical protein